MTQFDNAVSNSPHGEEEVLELQEKWIRYLQQFDHEQSILVTSPFYNKTSGELQPFGRRLTLKERDELGFYKRRLSGRTVLSCELVFENDNPDWAYMVSVIKVLLAYLDRVEIPYILTYSGSKSLHVHVFFDRSAITIDANLLEALREFDIDVESEIRAFLATLIIREAGIKSDDIDWANLIWTSMSKGSKGRIIRCIGSLRNDGKFKTLIREIPSEKPSKEGLVLRFPKEIKLWNPSLLNSQINKYLRDVVRYTQKPLRYEGREFKKLEGLKSIADIIPPDHFAKMKKVGEFEYAGEHVIKEPTVHKRYFTINIKLNVWKCFHHAGGGPLELIAIMEGIVSCEECKKGKSPLKGEKFIKVLKIAKEKYGITLSGEKGYDIDLAFENNNFGVLYLKEREHSYVVSISKGNEILVGETKIPKDFLKVKKTREEIFSEAFNVLDKTTFFKFIERIEERIEEALRKGKEEEKLLKEEKEKEIEKQKADVKEYASQLMKMANPLQFVINTVQSMHAGDEDIIEVHLNSFLGADMVYKNHTLSIGTTGVGKTDEMRKVFMCLPDEWKFRVDSSSDKAFYYAGQAGELKDKRFVFFDDIDPTPGIIETLKKLASDDPDDLTHSTVSKDRDYLKLVVSKKAILMGTTIEALTDKQCQILRRYQIYNPSESDKAKEAAKEIIKEEGRLPDRLVKKRYDFDVQVCQEIYRQYYAKNFDVTIPFDIDYPVLVHSQKTEFKAFMSLIKCITIANFNNRICVGSNILIASPLDFYEAVRLWKENLPLKVDTVAMQILKYVPDTEPFYDDVEEARKNGDVYVPPVTASDIAKSLKVPPRTVRDKTENLYAVGLIDRKQWHGRGKPWVFWKSPTMDTEKIENLRKIEIPTVDTTNYRNEFIRILHVVNKELDEKEKFDVQKVVDKIFSDSDGKNDNGEKVENNPGESFSLSLPYNTIFFGEIKRILSIRGLNALFDILEKAKMNSAKEKWILPIRECRKLGLEKGVFVSGGYEDDNENKIKALAFKPTAEDKGPSQVNLSSQRLDLNDTKKTRNKATHIERKIPNDSVTPQQTDIDIPSKEEHELNEEKVEGPKSKEDQYGYIEPLQFQYIYIDKDDIREHLKNIQIYSASFNHDLQFKPVIELHGRDTENNKHHFVVHGFVPYFYAKDEEGNFTTLYGDKVRKIEIETPWDIVKERDGYIHFEADVLYVDRFLIDTNITFPFVKPRILYLDFEENSNINEVLSMSYRINEAPINFVYERAAIIKELEAIFPYVDAICTWNLPYDLGWLKKLFLHDNEKDRYFEDHFICFDLLDLFEKTWKALKKGGLSSYTLDNVSEVVLGKKKIKIEKQVWELPLKELEFYNNRDVELLYELDQKLNITGLHTFLASKVGCRVSTTFNRSSVGDFVLLKKAKEKRVVMPSRKKYEKKLTKKKEPGYKGGYKYAKPGLYKDVVLYDVSSAYPRIAILKNISPEYDVNFFNEKEGFFPSVLKDLLQLKEETPKTKPEYGVYKEIVNALYGLLGASFSRIYSPKHAEAITQTLAGFMRSLTLDEVPYIDTDGIVFTCDEQQANSILNDRQRSFKINFSLTKEKFDSFYVFTRGHYVGRYKVDDRYEYQIRGISMRRGDAPLLLQQLQQFAIEKIMDGIPLSEIRKNVLDRLNRITIEPLENIIIPKGLGKPLDKYEANIQQKRAYLYTKKYFNYEPNLRFEKVRQLFIKEVPKDYEPTDVVNLPLNKLPEGFIIDFDKHREFILNGLKFLFENQTQTNLEVE